MTPVRSPVIRFRRIIRRIALAAALSCCIAPGLTAPAAALEWLSGDNWDRTVRLAREEGSVVIAGPADKRWEAPLKSFESDYPGIEVVYQAAAPHEFWPQLLQERKQDEYGWDLRVAAPDVVAYRMAEQGEVLAPVREMLVLPEVVGDDRWIGGFESIFFDNERKYLIGFGLLDLPVAWVNRDFVPRELLASLRDLRKPQWRGKISLPDPRHGAAIVNLAVLLRHPNYGRRFVRDLLDHQQLTVIPSPAKQVEALVSGEYPIAIGIVAELLNGYRKRGLADNIVAVPGIRKYANGAGGLIAINDAPHPNAAKVFANWLLSRVAQARIAKALNYNSRRADVAAGNRHAAVDIAQYGRYVPSQNAEMLPYYKQAVDLTRPLVKSKK